MKIELYRKRCPGIFFCFIAIRATCQIGNTTCQKRSNWFHTKRVIRYRFYIWGMESYGFGFWVFAREGRFISIWGIGIIMVGGRVGGRGFRLWDLGFRFWVLPDPKGDLVKREKWIVKREKGKGRGTFYEYLRNRHYNYRGKR